MADQFQTFDKAPIVGGTVTFRSWRVGVRELALGAVALVCLVLVLVLAALLGASARQLKEVRAGTSAWQQQQQNACRDSGCLRTTAHLTELLNTSADPCQDFFSFACGGYRVLNPVDEYTRTQTVYQQMRQVNEDRLADLLTSPVARDQPWSAEKKVKEFFRSCTDDFTREQRKGRPVVDQVLLPLLGGWHVLDPDWVNGAGSRWDPNAALRVVQADLWLDAFYSPAVQTDQFDSTKTTIVLYPGGSGRYMSWGDYNDKNPTTRQLKLQEDYRKFMVTVATLLARDASVADQDLPNRIQTFAADAYEVESKIAKFASNSRLERDAYSEAKKVTLDNLKQQTSNEIDWTMQMAYLFAEAGVTGSTKVVVPYPTYLTNLTAMLQALGSEGSDTKKRKMHNYLTWRVLEVYVQDLSWEYVHANRQVYVDKYGRPNFLGTQRYCFYLSQHYLDTALGALYVRSYFQPRNKDKMTDITQTVKRALQNMINANSWMDSQTKSFAIDKIKGSTFKIGYPDFFEDDARVDSVYTQLVINSSDFFANILSGNQQHRREWVRLLGQGQDRSNWLFNAYDTTMSVLWSWDEIIVPAGILQFPVYSYDMPHYYSFGAIGTLLGHYIHHLVDEYGRRWDKGGDYMGTDIGWWTNQTARNYDVARGCVANLYNNVTHGPYTSANGQQVSVAVNGNQFAGEAVAITTGIRLAYNAYQLWQQEHGSDPYPPGLAFTPQQLFFIAHAQLHCYNRDSRLDYLYALFNNANEQTRVNLALQELPEFQQTFNCKSTDRMVSPQPCPYY